MKRIPSTDTIESRIGCDRDTAILVRRLLDGRQDPNDDDRLPKTARWVRSCFNEPRGIELVMHAVDEALDTCGVEALRAEQLCDHYWRDTAAIYANNGQSYDATILYDVERDTFYAVSTGDWQETAERNRRFRLR